MLCKEDSACGENGVCTKSRCKCAEGFFGKKCEVQKFSCII